MQPSPLLTGYGVRGAPATGRRGPMKHPSGEAPRAIGGKPVTEEDLNDLRANWLVAYGEYVGNITEQAFLQEHCGQFSDVLKRELLSDIDRLKERQKGLQEEMLRLEQVPEIKKFADETRREE